MKNVKYCISRFIGGISLNGKEYVLNSSGNFITFNSYESAKKFLLKRGFKEGDIEENVFIDEMEIE